MKFNNSESKSINIAKKVQNFNVMMQYSDCIILDFSRSHD